MFEYIKGILKYVGADFCVIDVNGVGFKIYTSHITAARIGNSGDTVTLYTHMNVKEDEISLFGFSSREELSVFNMLIGVSGVGPKVGVAILTTMSPSEFSLAVATGDFKAISKSKSNFTYAYHASLSPSKISEKLIGSKLKRTISI